ncbi:hypothetical protein [Chitinophaga barathri]|uniref:Uncharacterized protein n=1 Tax=Chitinophaga barathri TaxID=1647451 RepID=A0A3N4M6C9_9BACT|nr:hypothetical protein [Chitinophaga barathri]RPD38665.1 hypothetical protein EG028_23420 [Chitinophaga barathri]
MRSLVLLLLSTLLLFACKKNKKDINPDAPFGDYHYQGITYTLQGDLKRDILDIYLSFHDGDKYDFIQKIPASDNELKMEGQRYYTVGADSIYFHGIEMASSSTVQGYRYTIKGDSMIMIRTVTPSFSRQIRVRRVR